MPQSGRAPNDARGCCAAAVAGSLQATREAWPAAATERPVPTPAACPHVSSHADGRAVDQAGVLRLDRWRCLGDTVDDVDHLVDAVDVVAGELDEFARVVDDGAAFGSTGDGDAAAAS